MQGKAEDFKRSQREQIFAREYLLDFNATRAAIAAGLAPKSAAVEASKLLRKPKIQALITKLIEKKFEKLDISAERILQELARLGFIDPANLFDEAGSLKPIHQMDEDTRRAIAGLDHDELFEYFGKGQRKNVGTTTKVKLADKIRALELLGKYLKLFTEKVEVTASEDLAALIAEGRKRAAQR
jgi:phage terminase small subunit